MSRFKFYCISLLFFCQVAIHTETIQLVPDPDFAKGVDWLSFPQKGMNSMVVASDGSVFMSSVQQNCLYKFGPDGRFKMKFGRKGEGPGDFNVPKVSSILDDRLLVIGEYALSRRISVFDLDGKFVKLLKTRGNCYSPIALKNNRLAYISIGFNDQKKSVGDGMPRTDTVMIVDVATGKEKEVTAISRIDRSFLPVSENYTISFSGTCGDTFIAAGPEGHLLIGSSLTSEIKVYSTEGKWLRSFDLGLPCREVSSEFVSRFRRDALKSFSNRPNSSQNKGPSPFQQAVERYDFRKLFGDRLPAYSYLQVTGDGRLLVLPYSDQVGETKGPFGFKVYDMAGRLEEDLVIETGSFQLEIDNRFRGLEVTPKALFAMVTKETEDGEERRIMRVSRKAK